ncbi:MAG: HD domain-containing protein [Clostridia bacterium]|nr:HD domain-containing protein [Clostridia bacterium]
MLQIPQNVKYILEKLNARGFEAYVVGGCVRDAIRKQVPHDWDICTSASPDEMKLVFAEEHLVETGLKHGTLTVVLDGEQYEVTTYRIDGDYSDGRHPDSVTFTRSLVEDLSRRDFTMNAIAFSSSNGFADPFHGADDIRKGIIRCVGNPNQRFHEDALRILRAMRFASVLQFSIEKETAAAMFANAELLKKISAERVRDELCKLLLGQNAGKVLMQFKDVLAVVIPEIAPCFGFQQNNPYHIYDVWEHTVYAVDAAPNDLYVRLTMLFHDLGKPTCYEQDENGIGHFYDHGRASKYIAFAIMRRLRFDKKTVKTVTELVYIHDRLIEPSSKTVRKMLNKYGEEQVGRLLDVRLADIEAQNHSYYTQRCDKIANLRVILARAVEEQNCVSLKDLAVSGKDLIKIGYQPGPQLGNVLKVLLDAVIENPEKNIKEELLLLARKELVDSGHGSENEEK